MVALATAVAIAGLAVASRQERQTAPRSAGGSDPFAEAFARMDEARRENPDWWRHRRRFRPTPTWTTVRRPPEGILDVTKPFPSAFYHLEAKGWQDWHAGWLTTVYAGAFTEDRPQGVVIVESSPYPLRLRHGQGAVDLDAPDRTRTMLYKSPVRAGSLRVVSVKGDVLRLFSDQGRRMTFDVSERKFRVL